MNTFRVALSYGRAYSANWLVSGGGITNLNRLNVYYFYECGLAIQELRKSANQYAVLTDLSYPCFNAIRWLDSLLSEESLVLQVVRAPVQKLKQRIVELQAKISEASAATTATDTTTEPKALGLLPAYYLGQTIDEFQAVLSAELGMADAYVIAKKGIYSTADLIERAENALSQNLRGQLPEQAIQDFREAGKCLALDLFTASGFHVLRATDAVLRSYYSQFVGKQPKPKVRNWGTYTRILRECVDAPKAGASPDLKTISLIDQIREMHRNPIVHPEDNLDEDKAIILFDVCKSAIVAMAVEMNLANAAKIIPHPGTLALLGKAR